MTKKPSLAILAPHVVQYHDPLYREIAATGKVNLEVIYCEKYGLEPHYDKSMGATIQWDIPLLQGYKYTFLKNLSWLPDKPLIGRVNPGIIRVLRQKKYDVVLIQNYVYFTSWLTLVMAKLLRMRIILRIEGNLKSSDINPFKRIIVRSFLNAADTLLYSCTGNHIWLQLHGGKNARLVPAPCSVDNAFFRQQHEQILKHQQSPKQQLGLRDDIPYIISVARLTNRKRVSDIIEAVSLLQRDGIQVGLIVAGNGPLHSTLQRQIEELGVSNTLLTGFVNMDSLSNYYAASDIFVLASDYDPSPKSLSEALIFSLPVVCTDMIGTAPDLVLDGKNGFLFSVGDVAQLASHLRLLVSDTMLREKMGQMSLKLSDQWSMQATAESIVNTVYDIMNQDKRATPL